MSDQSVLVVDDIPGFRAIICEMLEELGFPSCIEASDGAEAYEKAKLNRPALIISDYMMCPKTGMDLLNYVKEDPELRETPFILISAVAENEVFEKALSLGASGYIARPVGFEKLRKSVLDALASTSDLT